MTIDWSEAPEGFPIWLEDVRPGKLSAGDRDRSSWACEAQGEYTLYCLGGSRGWWAKSREGFDYIAHRQPAPWNGEGLPPVGTVCEFQGDCASCPSDPWHKDLHDGVECTVIAHFKSKDLLIVAFTFVRSDGHVELEQSLQGALKPIRTAEQIAAEQRECAVTDMCVLLGKDPNRAGVRAMAGVLYEAGYRKQVAP